MQPTFKQFLTEVFDQPYQWEWDSFSGARVSAIFKTENKTKMEVSLIKTSDKNQKYWYLSFGKFQNTVKTVKDPAGAIVDLNEYNASRIMATVIDVLKEFANKVDPGLIAFEAEKFNLGRSSFYQKVLDRALPKKYDVIINTQDKTDNFLIYNTEEFSRNE